MAYLWFFQIRVLIIWYLCHSYEWVKWFNHFEVKRQKQHINCIITFIEDIQHTKNQHKGRKCMICRFLIKLTSCYHYFYSSFNKYLSQAKAKFSPRVIQSPYSALERTQLELKPWAISMIRGHSVPLQRAWADSARTKTVGYQYD